MTTMTLQRRRSEKRMFKTPLRCAISIGMLLTLLHVSGCASQSKLYTPTAVPVDVRLHIEALNTAMEERFAAGDMAGVAEFYAEDGILLSSSGNRTEGREAIIAYWTRFAQGYRDLGWTLTVDLLEGDPDGKVVMQRGTSTIVRTPLDGDTQESTVEFVLIWAAQPDGTMRIAVDGYW